MTFLRAVGTLVNVLTFLAGKVWGQLEDLLASSASCRGAVAYVGREAPSILPLRNGDTIIIDGSDEALAAGSTHPDAVAVWLARKVNVRSLNGLHAKVLLVETAPAVAVIGSANVSAHSRDDLIEAAVVADDEAIVSQVADQLDIWTVRSKPLDRAWLAHARRTFRASRAPKPRRDRQSVTMSGSSLLWIGRCVPTPRRLSQAAQQALRTVEASADDEVEVVPWQLLPGDEQHFIVGHDVVLINEREGRNEPHGNARAWPPAVVARVIPGQGSYPPVAILVRELRPQRVTFGHVRETLAAFDIQPSWDEPLQPGEVANAVRALWRDEAP